MIATGIAVTVVITVNSLGSTVKSNYVSVASALK
jgi:hypothetical protein